MFQDVIKLIQARLVKTLENQTIIIDAQLLYDAYRSMKKAIGAIHVLEAHYLYLSLESSFLQDSQHGTPFQKWYLFTEQDFDSVRKQMREFLVDLIGITYCEGDADIHEHISIMETSSSLKYMFGFFSTYYESGKLSKDGLSIIFTKLNVGEKNIYEESTIDISTHEKRIALCQEIKTSVEEMQVILMLIKSYLLTNACLEDLL